MERRKNDFFVFQKMRFSRVHEKLIFTVSNKSLYQGATKKDFFGYSKIAFSVRHKKAIFSVYEK